MAAKGILVALFLLVMVNVHMGSACEDVEPTSECITWMMQGLCYASHAHRRICANTCGCGCGVKGPDSPFGRRRRDIDLLTSRFEEFEDKDNSTLERRRRQNNRKPQRLQGPDILRSKRQSSSDQVPFITDDVWDVPVLNDTVFWQDMGTPSISQPFIHWGHETGKREYPWQVAMKINGRFQCGGSIIGDQYVLTAAHCVNLYRFNPSMVKLSLGDWDLFTGSDQVNVLPTVSRITVHPYYSRRTLRNDIAVLKLQDKIDFSPNNIGSICLPGSGFNPVGWPATVTGWGRNEYGRLETRLNELTETIVSNEQCAISWRPWVTFEGLIQPSMLCVRSYGGGACNGDSGGPLVVAVNGDTGKRYVQVGIVSFGIRGCAVNSVPGVYTRVTYYLNWINQQMKH